MPLTRVAAPRVRQLHDATLRIDPEADPPSAHGKGDICAKTGIGT
jgi:hypothetical protein